MCQLLAMNCNVPTDIVFSFTGLSSRSNEHADCFGIAFFEVRGLRSLVDVTSAAPSPVAELVRSYPIRSTNVIAHIRKATVGRIALENCHPFVRELWGHYWVFAHNGDVPSFKPVLHGGFRPVGDTDSELTFCWIMQELAKNHADVPSPVALRETLRELAAMVRPHGTFNFVLSNGRALWAHCSTKLWYLERRHPFQAAHLQDEDVTVDFAQVTTRNDRVAVVVTEPLTVDERWTAFESGQLEVFVDGELLAE
ncbi:class II glutamine amidotransferase [soil metagenome]